MPQPSGGRPTILASSICSFQNWPSVCGSSPNHISMAGPKRYVRFLKDRMKHATGKTFQILRFSTKKKKEKLQRDLRESQRRLNTSRLSLWINPPHIICALGKISTWRITRATHMLFYPSRIGQDNPREGEERRGEKCVPFYRGMMGLLKVSRPPFCPWGHLHAYMYLSISHLSDSLIDCKKKKKQCAVIWW